MLCPACGEHNIPGDDLCDACGSDLAGLDLPEARHGFLGQLLSARIADLAVTPPVVVTSDDTVAAVVTTMREAKQGCALVVDDGALVGLFNERHLLTRVLRKDLDPGSTPVADVMSAEPLHLDPDDPPAFAIHCMVDYNFRHLPVVEGKELLGFISVRNILRYLKDELPAP